MKVKILFHEKYSVVAVMDRAKCPAEDFLLDGESSTKSTRDGLLNVLEHIAENGLENSAAWVHEANKKEGIYEFVKGKLRLFFFKGTNGQIAVCTTGVRKKAQKADKSSVDTAIKYKNQYFDAIQKNTLVTVDDDEEK